MANLNDFLFTEKSDTAVSDDGWILLYTSVDTMSGNDIVRGSGDLYGINNDGTILFGLGNDSLVGIATSVGIYNFSLLDMGEGNDHIEGEGDFSYGLYNYGEIRTGVGNDQIRGKAGLMPRSGQGILNGGKIDTGAGNDVIEAIGGDVGLYNFQGSINTGCGNDKVRGFGPDEDVPGIGILNNAEIKTGDGNDQIIGRTKSTSYQAIVNTGLIDTGCGNDVVDAITGGFGGSVGTVDLGPGNDKLIGFGSGNFLGGLGKDKLLFGEGTYTVNGGVINGVMNVFSFETIGGVNGGLFAYGNGTLTVDSNGVGTFA